MAAITLGSSSGTAGDAVSVTLNSADLVEIVSTPYYEDTKVWNKVYAIFSNGDQEELVDVTSGSGVFQLSAVAQKGTWSLVAINIIDYDSGTERVTVGLPTVTYGVIAPDTPTVTNPAADATGVTFPLSFTTSAYNVTGQTNDTHIETDWVIKDAANNTIFASRNDSSNLESISVPETGFATSTTYYARARHEGAQYGTGDWSSVNSFTTAESFAPPTFDKVSTSSALSFPLNNPTLAIYENSVSSTSGSYNTTTGIFTCEATGTLTVTISYESNSVPNWNANHYGYFDIYNEGDSSTKSTGDIKFTRSAPGVISGIDSYAFSVVSGETYSIKVWNDYGSGSNSCKFSGNSTNNYVTWDLALS